MKSRLLLLAGLQLLGEHLTTNKSIRNIYTKAIDNEPKVLDTVSQRLKLVIYQVPKMLASLLDITHDLLQSLTFQSREKCASPFGSSTNLPLHLWYDETSTMDSDPLMLFGF